MKTLKDLDWPDIVEKEELRSCAREWVSFLEAESFKSSTDYPYGVFQADWIRHFFNLMEDSDG